MSYGPDLDAIVRRAATHADRILRGASPAQLPVELPTTHELVLNLRVAKALGLVPPPALQAQATRVIE
jgi:putative ABC transport system substrate-binding protein